MGRAPTLSHREDPRPADWTAGGSSRPPSGLTPRQSGVSNRAGGSEPVVRELRRTTLEGQDLGVLDPAIADLDSPADRLVRVPRRRPGDHCPEVRQQRFADLPGGGIPEIRRAVIHGVVVHALTYLAHRILERRGARPLEPHTVVARDVDE